MIGGRGFTLTIRTPEGIRFAYPLAGPVIRSLAQTVDFLFVLAVVGTLAKLASVLETISIDLARALNVVAYFVVSVGYAMVMEWCWRGQTVGKRLLGLRVVDAHGLRLQPSQVILRNLLRFVDMLPAFYFVGGTASVFSERAQRLGDIAAGTVVIRTPKFVQPDLQQIAAVKYNSLLQEPHLAARLRQRVAPEAAQIALQAVLRRDEFEPVARAQVFRELHEYFDGIVTFPPELVESLADEQYVRNIVQIFFLPISGASDVRDVTAAV